ncbi:hypothetical protein [uncultured Sphingomonas sp.]|uniref:hypothetical protein n=1 Tax=uncultured Sphingomonas sp. TaxID=158754 RepID=UPI003749FC55
MLDAALARVAAALRIADDPWWVIGSAAVWIHGAATPVADIDVLLSARDAARVLGAWQGAVSIGEPSAQFRSHPFARLNGAAMPIELMADLELRVGDAWRPVRPLTRERRGGVYVPARAELAAILHAFGRPKDVTRAMLLG